MNPLGIIVHLLVILIAGLVGSMVRGKWRVEYQKLSLQVLGVAVIVMGALHAWRALFVLDGAQFETTGTLLVVVALALGLLFGEAVRVDLLLDKLGEWLRGLSERESEKNAGQKGKGKSAAKGAKGQKSTKATERDKKNAIRLAKEAARASAKGEAIEVAAPDVSATDEPAPKKRRKFSELPTYDLDETRTGHLFTDGFVLATLLCVFNSLTFAGAIAGGVSGETDLLMTKAVIDAVIVLVLASVYGSGVTFSAGVVAIVEGLLFVVAAYKPDLMTDTLIDHFSLVAAVITIGAGICLAFGKRWRVINLVPALLVSPIYGLVMMLVEKYAEK